MAVLTYQTSSRRASDRTQAREDTPLLSPSPIDKPGVDEVQFFKTALCVGFLTFVSGLEVTVVATVGPAIGRVFSKASLSLFLGTTFLVSSAVSTLICGRSSDVYGRRLTTVATCFLYTVGCVVCATATSIPGIFVGRAIAGFGLGGMGVMISVILSETVPLKSRALWHSIGKLVSGIAMAAGGPIGGWVSDRFAWRAVFYAQIPLGLISATAANLVIQERETFRCSTSFTSHTSPFRSSSAIPYVLGVLSVTAFVFSVSGATSAFALSKTFRLSLGLVAVLAIIGLLYTCFFAKKSSAFRRHLKSRNISSTILLTCFSSLVHQSILYNVPLFATSISQVSATVAGAYMTPVSVAAVLATLIAGLRISKSGKYKRMMLLGAVFTTLGPVSFTCISIFSPSSPLDVVLEVLSSFPTTFGSQLLNAISIVVLLASSEASDVAELTSYSALSKSLGGVIGTALSGFLLETFLSNCKRHELQGDSHVIIGSSTGVKLMTDSLAIGASGDMYCLRRGFSEMFAIVAIISTVNIALLYFGVDEVPLNE